MVRLRSIIYIDDRLDLSYMGPEEDKTIYRTPSLLRRAERAVLAERSVRASDRNARPRGPSGSISGRRRERALEIDTGHALILIEVSDLKVAVSRKRHFDCEVQR
jgi:hypothetical protein